MSAAQAFGRFGYSDWPTVPGFRLSESGFRVASPMSDTFRYLEPRPMNPVAVDRFSATLATTPRVGLPDKLRVDLNAPGFEIHVTQGLQLRTLATLPPLLTVPGEPDNVTYDRTPTPGTNYVLVSFQTAQPPILLNFMDDPTSVVVEGRPGSFVLRTNPDHEGWIRVVLPWGLRSEATLNVNDLGELFDRFERHSEFWTQTPPRLVETSVTREADSVRIVWRYDRPGALVPFALMLAKQGGYPISILSAIESVDADVDEGPLAYTREPRLAVRFPMRRLPGGRATVLGETRAGANTDDPMNPDSVATMALRNLLGDSPPLLQEAARNQQVVYLDLAEYFVEPWTGQRMPYDQAGSGMEVAAAHGLLAQALKTARGAPGDPNAFFTSVIWRLDWLTWRLWTEDPAVSRRAAAYAAISGALTDDLTRQYEAALLQAGIAAERGVRLFLSRRGREVSDIPLEEPFFQVRRGLFGLVPELQTPNPIFDALNSPLRVVSDHVVRMTTSERGLVLEWEHDGEVEGPLELLSDSRISLLPDGNLQSLEVRQLLGRVIVDYVPTEPGVCRAVVRRSRWATPIPDRATIPTR